MKPVDTSALPIVTLNFFDLKATIRSDSHAYINLFTNMYRRFLPNGDTSSLANKAEFTVFTGSNNDWGQPTLVLDEKVWPINNKGLLEGFAYESVLNEIVAKVRSHFLIHAGVVSHNNQGIIISADSGHGKTTLVLQLLQRGCSFLSDEMAAIGRADSQVYPFPRALRLRPDTLEKVGFSESARKETAKKGTVWLSKRLIDVEDVQPNSFGQTVPIKYIIFLKNPATPDQDISKQAEQELDVLVERLDVALLAGIKKMPDVSKLQIDQEQGYPLLKIQAKNRTSVLSSIEALCQEHKILVLDVIKRKYERPTFDTAATLTRIPNSQATIELLKQFLGGHKSSLLQEEFGGSSTRLFMELMGLIGQSECYELQVGPLEEVTELVTKLVGLTNH